MSMLAPTLQAFFTDRLARQRQASPRTVAAYRDTFRLLLAFVQRQIGKAPFALSFEHIEAPVIVAFLNHIEADRHNSPRTRNTRLAAIRSFFRYAALRHIWKFIGEWQVGPAAPGARRGHSASARHTPEALRPSDRVVPEFGGARRRYRCSGPHKLGRPT